MHDGSGPPADDLDAPPAVEGGRIDGVVTDFSGVPLVGVRVEAAASGGGDLDLLPALSDGEGRFEILGLREGRYDLRFLLGRVKARVLAVPTGTDQLRVKLARPQGLLLVVRAHGEEPPPAMVHLVLDRHTSEGLVREHVGRTLDTRMLLWSIRPGTYTVTAWGGDHLPVVVDDVQVREGEPAPEVEIVFSAQGASVQGTVTTADGAPATGLVGWRRLDQEGHVPRHVACMPTDEQGAFTLRGLVAGRYRVHACDDGPSAMAQQEVDVPTDGLRELTLVLGAGMSSGDMSSGDMAPDGGSNA